MRFTCFGQVQPPGCIAPSDTLSSHALDRGVNRLSVFCPGGGGVSLRAAGDNRVEKIIIAGKRIMHHRTVISVTADRHLSLISFCPVQFLFLRTIFMLLFSAGGNF
jgi:hypothetical protein